MMAANVTSCNSLADVSTALGPNGPIGPLNAPVILVRSRSPKTGRKLKPGKSFLTRLRFTTIAVV